MRQAAKQMDQLASVLAAKAASMPLGEEVAVKSGGMAVTAKRTKASEVREREREREMGRGKEGRERERERDGKREGKRERGRERERWRVRVRERGERVREGERVGRKRRDERERNRQTDRQTDRESDFIPVSTHPVCTLTVPPRWATSLLCRWAAVRWNSRASE